jgi:hypothetical protein
MNRRGAQAGRRVEFTILAKHSGRLTKVITLTKGGEVFSDGSACSMAKGSARRVTITDLKGLAAVIEKLQPSEAIALGALRDGLRDQVEIITKEKLEKKLNGVERDDLTARTNDSIIYRKDEPALALLDYDKKAMPENVAAKLKKQDFWSALVKVAPGLKAAAHLLRRSTSAGLSRTDTGEALPGSGGWHGFVVTKDGADIPRFLTALHQRCWLAGYGWLMVGEAGQLLERSIVDKSVGSSERLVFEAAPTLRKPVAQDAKTRKPIVIAGKAEIDTRKVCPDLTAAERATFNKLIAAAKATLQPEADRAKAAYVECRAGVIAKRTGIPLEEAKRQVETSTRGFLLPEFVLKFVKLGTVTVGDVLDDPEKFEDESLADPLAGISYGRNKAKLYLRRRDNQPWIKSFAHGNASYLLLRKAPDDPTATVASPGGDAGTTKAKVGDADTGVGVKLTDFHAYMPMHNYIFAPSREPWPGSSVNSRIAPIVVGIDADGKQITMKATSWIDQNQPVEQMTWAPGLPMIITDRLIANGGWIERKGVACFNLYRPPTIKPG